jgi:hypothetical protein
MRNRYNDEGYRDDRSDESWSDDRTYRYGDRSAYASRGGDYARDESDRYRARGGERGEGSARDWSDRDRDRAWSGSAASGWGGERGYDRGYGYDATYDRARMQSRTPYDTPYSATYGSDRRPESLPRRGARGELDFGGPSVYGIRTGVRGYSPSPQRADWNERIDSSWRDRSTYGERSYGGNREEDSSEGGLGHRMMEGIKSAFRGRGPKGYKRSDERIREDVCDRLSHLSVHAEVDASEVEVSVRDGEVTLTGSVVERRWKHMMEDVADNVMGVRDVHNQIRVRRADEAAERTAPTADNGRRAQTTAAQRS